MKDYYKIYALHRKKGWMRLTVMHDSEKAINYVNNLDGVDFLTAMIIKHHVEKNMDEAFYLRSRFGKEKEKAKVKRR
jgi:hypothetical protein